MYGKRMYFVLYEDVTCSIPIRRKGNRSREDSSPRLKSMCN